MNERIKEIQNLLQRYEIPAWLFFDFRKSDPIAYSVLGLDPEAHSTRRWFYLVPAEGRPQKLVHRIESAHLDSLPGDKAVYLDWRSLDRGLGDLLSDVSSVAMQYSERNRIPYISLVDAGTAEMVREHGIRIQTSADLVQHFDSCWTPPQLEGHRRTARKLTSIVREAFEESARRIRDRREPTEYEIQQFILQRFAEEDLQTDYPPIVAAGAHSGDPHYSPDPESSTVLEENTLLMIDLWAREKGPQSVFADITWMAFLGSGPDPEHLRIFDLVRSARDRGLEFLQERIAKGEEVSGFEVDDTVRSFIENAGHGPDFVHRTGHNLDRQIHGNGVNLDNLETHDTRAIIPRIALTIEPGVYLDSFGVRSEINIYIHPERVEVTTPPQRELIVQEIR